MREIQPSPVRQFVGVHEDCVYTVIPDGSGSYIVLMHNAYGEIQTDHHLAKHQVELLFNIKL